MLRLKFVRYFECTIHIWFMLSDCAGCENGVMVCCAVSEGEAVVLSPRNMAATTIAAVDFIDLY